MGIYHKQAIESREHHRRNQKSAWFPCETEIASFQISVSGMWMLCFQKSLRETWIKASPSGAVRQRSLLQEEGNTAGQPWVSGNPASLADRTKSWVLLSVMNKSYYLRCLGKSNEISCLKFGLLTVELSRCFGKPALPHWSCCLEVVFGLCGSGFWRDSFSINYCLFLFKTVVLEQNAINGARQTIYIKFGIHWITNWSSVNFIIFCF